MSWLSEFLHPGNAYKQAGEKEQQGYNEAQGYREPYLGYGKEGGDALTEFMKKLSNPGALQNEWSQGYEQSPYAQQLQQENQASGMDTASAMGLGGSSAALQNIQRGAGDIMQKDRQNYMNDLMQKYMQGIGIGENMFGVGANTAGGAATGAQQHGENQGQYTFGQNTAGGNQMMNIMSLIAAYMGGKGGGGGGGMQWPGTVNYGGG